MSIYYKIDIIGALKDAGYSTYRIRKESILPQYTLQSLRKGQPITFASMETICNLLHIQPGDIIGYKEEKP